MSDIDHVNKEIARVPKPLAKVWTKHVEARTIWEKLKGNLNTFQWDIFADKVRQKGKVRIIYFLPGGGVDRVREKGRERERESENWKGRKKELFGCK